MDKKTLQEICNSEAWEDLEPKIDDLHASKGFQTRTPADLVVALKSPAYFVRFDHDDYQLSASIERVGGKTHTYLKVWLYLENMDIELDEAEKKDTELDEAEKYACTPVCEYTNPIDRRNHPGSQALENALGNLLVDSSEQLSQDLLSQLGLDLDRYYTSLKENVKDLLISTYFSKLDWKVSIQ